MFSASTQVGAQATLAALDAGAIDFLPKKLDEINGDHEVARRILRYRVRNVALQAYKRQQQPKIRPVRRIASQVSSRQLTHREFDLLVIVASTGGPVAIQKTLTEIPAHCPIPILLIQHMPGNFTCSFAQRLNQLSQLQVHEAKNNDELQAGVALLAPGGQQIEVQARGTKRFVVLKPKQVSDIYSPCADISLASVAKVYKNKALAIVLTGMGADGRQGAIKIHQAGAEIWAQEESSCIIYGMPKAVADAGIVSKVCTLDELSKIFREIN
jgi:two-component system chemotaxis response regulator CheB